MSVSLDGHEALHDRFRGKGSHGQVIQGIENALNAGISLFLFTVACKSLLSSLPYFVRDVYRSYPSIKSVTVIPIINTQNGDFFLAHEFIGPNEFLELVRSVSLLNLGGCTVDFLHEPLVNVVSKEMNMPWIHESPPLFRQGSIIVMANRDVRLYHSSRHSFAQYRPGMIEKVLSSEDYQKTVAPDVATCPTCRYVELCRENGMDRPSEPYDELDSDAASCRQILDKIEAGG